MDVKVNKGEWDGVSAEDRKKIEQIVSSHFKGTSVVPDTSAPTSQAFLTSRKMQTTDFNICTAACGVAEAGAVAACALLTGGVAIAVCVAAAHAAGDWCRSQC